jgi:putative copper export protein
MDWPVIVVQWLHVLLGILWLGNALVLAVIVIPAMDRLPIIRQREIGSAIGLRSNRVFRIVVPLIIILGIVRGTVFGPIRSVDLLLGTPYGQTWLVALVVTTLTYLFGLFVIVPSVTRMEHAALSEDGTATPELEFATERVKRLVVIELVGFVVIFTCMILMRFGL